MKGNGRFAQRLRQFMSGRYGVDHLSRFLSVLICVILVLSLLTRKLWNGYLSGALSWAAIFLLIWSYWRVFSRNYTARQRENGKYLSVRSRVVSECRLVKDRFRYRREYRFYRCPGCKSVVRVPKGKGKIRITCRRCGYSFEKKT